MTLIRGTLRLQGSRSRFDAEVSHTGGQWTAAITTAAARGEGIAKELIDALALALAPHEDAIEDVFQLSDAAEETFI